MRTFRVGLPLAAVVALLTAAGCGASGDATTVTVVERTVVQEAAPAPAPKREREKPKREREPKRVAADADPADGGIQVPDVVGMDHQLAQDTMQSVGLYMLMEEDATGQGRMLLWDRNWVVVDQSPPAGSTVSEDTTITLFSKKDGE